MKFKIGDSVVIMLGLYSNNSEIATIIDIEYIKEIDVEDYYIQTKKGHIVGPYHSWAFKKCVCPNDILKELING